MTTKKAPSARERLVDTSYELFTRRGISDVGIDEVVAKARVAKATLYRHFPSKDDLISAYLGPEQMNHPFRIFESLVLRIKRPGAICTIEA